MRTVQDQRRAWWARPGLEVRSGRLTIAGRDAGELARSHGTPLYVHDLERVAEQAQSLWDALEGSGLRGVVRLALKAQRDPDLLGFLRERTPFVGMDVCSPGEVDWALRHGWAPEEISFTGTNLSDGDLDRVLAAAVHVNVDLLSQLDRVGRMAPGRAVGIRVNPGIGATFEGGNETLYAGSQPTKFGILPGGLDEALSIARRHRLVIDTVHYHSGYLYLSESIPVVEEAARRVREMTGTLIDAGCPISEVNTGGGLGVAFRPGDRPLDLPEWAAALARQLGPLGVAVGTEPGEYLVKEAAVHLAEAVSVEDRGGATFVGLDTGWNVVNEHFVYGIPFHPILCRAADAEPAGPVTLSGNINEGNDLFAENWPMPEVREGDIVAIPNVGSYNASMTSEHCLRPPARVVSFIDRI
jgi:diaminopimelate decarboxylase